MLKPQPIPPIPAETVRVIHTILPKGNPITRLCDEFGSIYEDADFAELFSKLGQPAIAPWRLALVTVFQFLENLTDRLFTPSSQCRHVKSADQGSIAQRPRSRVES